MSELLSIIGLSLKVAALATLVTLPIGTYLGWLFSRKHFRGKILIDGLVHVPLVLPPVVTGYFMLILLGPNGFLGRYLEQWFGITIAFTWKAAVVAAAIVSLPLLVRAVRVAVDTVDIRLEDAARTLGAPDWNIFFSITMPLALHGVVAGGIMAFARALGEFGATIIFAGNFAGKTRTIPLAIFTYLNQPEGEDRAKILVLVAVILAYLSVLGNEWLLRRFRKIPRADVLT